MVWHPTGTKPLPETVVILFNDAHMHQPVSLSCRFYTSGKTRNEMRRKTVQQQYTGCRPPPPPSRKWVISTRWIRSSPATCWPYFVKSPVLIRFWQMSPGRVVRTLGTLVSSGIASDCGTRPALLASSTWASCQIRKIEGCACAEYAGNVRHEWERKPRGTISLANHPGNRVYRGWIEKC